MAPKNNKYLKYQLQIKFIFDICGWVQIHNGKIQESKSFRNFSMDPHLVSTRTKKKNDMDIIVYHVSFYHPHLMIWIILK